MSMGGGFLGGAGGRLLPPSIPFRFFIAAAGFQVLAWLMLLLGAADLARYSGGSGVILAAIHLLTLGVLAMAGIGASYQLLPVVTRRALGRTWPTTLSFWLFTPGVAMLSYAMINAPPAPLIAGGVLVGAGLAVFVTLTIDNLRRTRAIPVVTAHGWGAMVVLVGVVGLGLMLILDFGGGFLADHQSLANLHMGLAIFGFMGLLVLGFSQVLIPMFVLSTAPKPRPGWVQLVLAIGALILFSIGRVNDSPVVLILAGFLALLAAFTYISIMITSLNSSMRKRHGRAFVLIKSSWALLILALLLGLAILLGLEVPNGAALFGFVALAGWLLTFLMGVLQRILPFLASMHGANSGGRPPLLSDLTPEMPLNIHLVCHYGALLLVGIGILMDLTILIQLGAFIGSIGAIAFGVFSIVVVIRMSAPRP